MIIGLVIVIVYAVLILYFTTGFKATQLSGKSASQFSFSIIIPFRNEEKHLPNLLRSLNELQYPESLFEIILVDDHSEDKSQAICRNWKAENPTMQIKLLDNQNLVKSPKKSAVLTALQYVENEYILTTDADCLLPEEWLSTFNQFLQQKPSDLVAGPVKLIENSGFWTKFQVLDMMSLQVVGLGSFNAPPALFCNAANLCYKTDTLKAINPFERHQDIASGDDVFNLEAFQRHKKHVTTLLHPKATVWTKGEKDFAALTQQRIRWASKAKFYSNGLLKFLGLLVLLTNLLLVLSLAFIFIFEDLVQFWWLFWVLKLSIDFYVLYVGNRFFRINLCFRDYLMMLVVYPFISSYFALLALKGKFSWKGRVYEV